MDFVNSVLTKSRKLRHFFAHFTAIEKPRALQTPAVLFLSYQYSISKNAALLSDAKEIRSSFSPVVNLVGPLIG